MVIFAIVTVLVCVGVVDVVVDGVVVTLEMIGLAMASQALNWSWNDCGSCDKFVVRRLWRVLYWSSASVMLLVVVVSIGE